MDERHKETLMASVMSDTLENVKSKFNQYKPIIPDENFFDYELLKAALNRKDKDVIYFLIELGCRVRNPNKVNSEETPLHLAVKYGNGNIIHKILLSGASLYDKNENGETAIYAGFKQGNHRAVMKIFKILDLHYSYIRIISSADYKEDPTDIDNIIYFHIACVMNNLVIVKHYLNFGFDVNGMLNLNSVELSTLNPLHYAATKKYYALYECLVKHGADLSIENGSGLTTLHISYYNCSNHKEIIERIFDYGNETKFINSVDNNGVSHFHLCCMTSNPKNVQVFIDKGVDVNSPVSLSCSKHPGFTPLHFSVKYGSEEVVQLLLQNGADCNKTDKESNTPLHLASNSKIIQLLLANGADCNQVDKEGRTPLHLACEQKFDTSIIEMLLNYSACASAVDDNKSTPLHAAFYNSPNNFYFYKSNIFDVLISKIPRQVNITDSQGLSYFHIICTGNNRSRVEDYLKSGVAVNSCVKSGRFRDYTALHFAILYNQIEIVELLLNWNAQVNFNTDQAPTPLHLACECNFVKFKEVYTHFEFAKENNELINLDWTLNRTNQLNIIKLLILHGADVENKEFESRTALLSSCKDSGDFPHYYSLQDSLNDEICFRTKKIIEILLFNNANINAQTYRKESILHIICENSYLKESEVFVNFLITKGADIHATDYRGYTPLHSAVNKDLKLVQIYLKHKVNVNAKTKDFLTPLELLYQYFNDDSSNDRGILCALLECGSDVNIRLRNGRMMVFDAIKNYMPFMVKKLLHYGADIIAENSEDNLLVSIILEWHNRFTRFGCLECAGNYCTETFQIVFIHVQKLLALGNANEHLEQCNIKVYERYNVLKEADNIRNLDNVYSNCIEELDKMKLVKIDNYTSLHSILIKDAHELSKHVKNETFAKILEDPNVDVNFPLYSNLLKIQYKKGLELDKMKLVKIDNYTSLQSILIKDAHELSKYVKNETFVNILAKSNDDGNFPLYSYLLKRQYKKGLVRSYALQSANAALSFAIGFSLPDLCCDSILQYLTNEEIVHLKTAVITSCKSTLSFTKVDLPEKFQKNSETFYGIIMENIKCEIPVLIRV